MLVILPAAPLPLRLLPRALLPRTLSFQVSTQVTAPLIPTLALTSTFVLFVPLYLPRLPRLPRLPSFLKLLRFLRLQ